MFSEKGIPGHPQVFPIIPALILVIAVLWALSDMNIFVLNVPWLPLIVIIMSLKWLLHYFMKK